MSYRDVKSRSLGGCSKVEHIPAAVIDLGRRLQVFGLRALFHSHIAVAHFIAADICGRLDLIRRAALTGTSCVRINLDVQARLYIGVKKT